MGTRQRQVSRNERLFPREEEGAGRLASPACSGAISSMAHPHDRTGTVVAYQKLSQSY